MARKGITENDVAEAMGALNKAGLSEPSVRMIHQKLGQGSLTTIVKHKRAIEAQQRSTDPTLLPDSVQVKISEIVQTVWLELAEAADSIVNDNNQRIAKYKDAEQHAIAQAEAANERVSDLAQDLQAAQLQVEKLEKEVNKQLKANEQTSNRNQVLKSELAGITREKASQAKQIEQLVAEREASARRLDDALEQHRLERAEWEQNRRGLQKALDAQTKTDANRKNEINALTTQVQSLKSLSAEYKKERDQTAAENKSLNKEQKALSKSIGALESALSTTKRQHSNQERQWKDKFGRLEKELNSLKNSKKKKQSN